MLGDGRRSRAMLQRQKTIHQGPAPSLRIVRSIALHLAQSSKFAEQW